MSLAEDLLAFIREPAPNAARFEELALRAWRWQLEGIPFYGRFCAGRGALPDRVRSWRDVPALPVDAFKLVDLVHEAEPATRRFTTSGTTSADRADARPGSSWFGAGSLTIMDAAITVNAERMLFGGERFVVLVLAPPPERAPHMIMAYGMQRIVEAFGVEGSRFLVGERGLDEGALFEAIEGARRSERPVCLIGASFGFVNLLDGLAAKGARVVPLPPGSRIMDAGGYKGRSRELTPATFRAMVGRAFDVPDHGIVNLLGMTELASQIYDTVVADRASPRRKLPPPWMRTRVVDPEEPTIDVAEGDIGVLLHFDLASHARPCAILSDDLGRRCGDGFEIVGRVRASGPRGCSIKVDELLAEAAQ